MQIQAHYNFITRLRRMEGRINELSDHFFVSPMLFNAHLTNFKKTKAHDKKQVNHINETKSQKGGSCLRFVGMSHSYD